MPYRNTKHKENQNTKFGRFDILKAKLKILFENIRKPIGITVLAFLFVIGTILVSTFPTFFFVVSSLLIIPSIGHIFFIPFFYENAMQNQMRLMVFCWSVLYVFVLSSNEINFWTS